MIDMSLIVGSIIVMYLTLEKIRKGTRRKLIKVDIIF